jgi:hypothetical protein
MSQNVYDVEEITFLPSWSSESIEVGCTIQREEKGTIAGRGIACTVPDLEFALTSKSPISGHFAERP